MENVRKLPSNVRNCLRKIVGREELAREIEALHKIGLQVGFTNGCFDLLHLGHLDSLLQAREICDFLVVAVNSDKSVKRIKGHTRPIQDEKTRSTLLAALECVNRVILFDEDSALQLVDLLRPDIVAKEGYDLENWPEAQHVLAYGGKVVRLMRKDGYSTTQIVERIRGVLKNEDARY